MLCVRSPRGSHRAVGWASMCKYSHQRKQEHQGSPRKKRAMAPVTVEPVDQETNGQLIMHWIHALKESRCWGAE